ncbi:helix-turn-helix domain-containing protein [Cellulomonas citrea]|uniref:helix-turn-helix domain-containing protein n=1 Tax=Cellulomonas citrea TaxID=1909423 RepID=UPI00135BD7E6|nr:helix-turn-helix domain-containing protein [Cellulomonas citrea]
MSDIEIIQTPRVMLNVVEVAKRLSVGRSTMYELIPSGEIESVHIGRLHRVPADCLHEFVARCRRQQSVGEP